MSVILATTADLRREGFDCWCAIGMVPTGLDPARRAPDLGRRLDSAFDAIRDQWLALARELGREPTARFAHTPAAAANVSDMGLMMAWTRVVDEFAASPQTMLVVCNDPWLFRHLANRPGVQAGFPPALGIAELVLRLRGLASRFLTALCMSRAAFRFSHQRTRAQDLGKDLPWIMAYAHPASASEGTDVYFGTLMKKIDGLARILHVDGPDEQTQRICETDTRTFSLHAFGSPLFALSLFIVRWRPRIEGPWAWLIRRAAAREGGTGQAAMIAWQIHCQERWLARARPDVVAWPWENHSWERAFVRVARARGVRTVGYQHASIGRREWNYAPGSNVDGPASIPDLVLCSGQAWAERLLSFGHKPENLTVAGAWRTSPLSGPATDPAGPVFVALPSDHTVAAEMIAAIRPLARRDLRFVVREHPMTPFPFTAETGIERATGPLSAHRKISAVMYAGTTVGLEASLAGLPTVRFLPQTQVANDILPDGMDLPTTTEVDLGDALDRAVASPPFDSHTVFAPIEIDIWRAALGVPRPAPR